MTRTTMLLTLLAVLAPSQPAGAQATPGTTAIEMLKVSLLVSRHQGEKKVAAVPLALAVPTTGEVSHLRMWSELPVATTTFAPAEGAPPVASFNYRNVGTSVSAVATRVEEGRYKLSLTIESSWIEERAGKESEARHGPRFGTFRAEQKLLLTDGQSARFTSAADALAEQIIDVDVSVARQR